MALPAASIAGLEQRGGGVADSWSHAKPRSREGKRTGGWFGVVNGVIVLAVLLRLFAVAGCSGPLTPVPSPPFHGGEGGFVDGVWRLAFGIWRAADGSRRV